MKRSTNGNGAQSVVITCTEVAKQGWPLGIVADGMTVAIHIWFDEFEK